MQLVRPTLEVKGSRGVGLVHVWRGMPHVAEASETSLLMHPTSHGESSRPCALTHTLPCAPLCTWTLFCRCPWSSWTTRTTSLWMPWRRTSPPDRSLACWARARSWSRDLSSSPEVRGSLPKTTPALPCPSTAQPRNCASPAKPGMMQGHRLARLCVRL